MSDMSSDVRMEVGRVAKRKTKNDLWREEQTAVALAHFERTLCSLPDPRRSQGVRYPLRSVTVIALMAMVCGADDAQAMQSWGEANEEWLEEFLELPHGTPTQDVFLSVFAALDSDAFSEVFQQWVALLKVRRSNGKEQIALDGKTSRRTHDRSADRPAIHTVSAWLVDEGLVLGQIHTKEKSNEITAIPELLNLLHLNGATVSIDAMGCQKAIAKTIVERGGDYLLAVKDNQPTLRQDIAASFFDGLDERSRPLDEPPPLQLEHWQHTDAGHGRVEERQLQLCRDLSWLTTASDWPKLALIARAITKRTVLSTGKVSIEQRYFICSDTDAPIERIAAQVRNHWHIENKLHWVLDMAFNEDQSRHRAENCAKNLTVLRHFSLNLLKSEPTAKLGVANKRKRAGWDRSYLLSVLAGARK